MVQDYLECFAVSTPKVRKVEERMKRKRGSERKYVREGRKVEKGGEGEWEGGKESGRGEGVTEREGGGERK